MSHRLLAATFLLVTLLSCSLRSHGQEQAPVTPEDRDTLAVTRKQAVALLFSVASQVNTLRSGENRARIGSNLVESLWEFDEKRARGLLATVQEDITAGLNDTDVDYESHTQTLMIFLQLRRDTLARIAGRDPELALNFLRATRPPPDIPLPYAMKDVEANLELQLADAIAVKSPQLALKLGRQALARGLSPELKSVLFKLQANDKEAARSLHQEIVEKLKRVNLAEDSAALEFALDLTRSFPPPRATESVYRELLGVVLAGALANGCATADPEAEEASNFCYQAASVFSLLEKYYGAQATPLKRWVDPDADAERRMRDSWQELNDEVAEKTVDEILALAEAHPDNKQQVYWLAFEKAAGSGDLVRARQIATGAPDPELRESMLARLQESERFSAASEQKLALTQQQLSALRNDEARLQYLLSAATQIAGKDRKAALGLLDQAAQIIGGVRAGRKQVEGQLALAMLYCSLRSERGFAIMESLVPKLNELVAAAITLDGFDNNYLRDGEWNMSAQGGLGTLLNALAQNAGYFARFDFDRAATLASQFDRAEIRLMAQLKLAQSVLGKPPKVFPLFQPERQVIID
ncbi:MAG: hypothetical protein QOJ88_4 [Pyrinomonadaceae bacterium]|jgi:hypothetical protein|nr:hypothetical protein [Pyrinomonadaceae bacterium]